MLPSSPLLRFKDLKRVGINNWPTLKRRVEKDGLPPGRYIGDNTRAWTEEEVTAWWDKLPSAGAPPEKLKPAAPVTSRDDGRDSNIPSVTPSNSNRLSRRKPSPMEGG